MYPGKILDTFLYSFVIIISVAFFWYCRRLVKTFSGVPSIFDKRLFLKVVTSSYRRESNIATPLLNLVFAICKHFRKEGLVFGWFFKPIVMVYNEEYVKVLCNNKSLVDKTFFANIIKQTTGDGLLTHDGFLWKKRRKMAKPAFRLDALKSQMSIFNNHAKDAVRRLSEERDKPTVDIHHIIKITTLQNICESIFGPELNYQKYEQTFLEAKVYISSLMAYTLYRFTRPWLFWKNLQPLFQVGREHQKSYEDMENFTKFLVEETLKSKSPDRPESEDSKGVPVTRTSLFHVLYENHLNDPSFTMKHIEEEIRNVLIAGHDTVANAMNVTLYLLATHPEIQDKVFQEIDSVMAGSDADIIYDDLSNLTYLDSVIKETMRLYPPIPMFSRNSTEDIICGKYKIPKNTIIVFVLFLLHRDPDIYPDPDKFDPERFYGNSQKQPWAFIPFAEGYRNCIGKVFAMWKMNIFLAHILRNFKISLMDQKQNLTLDWKVVLHPKTPIQFKITCR